VIGGVVINVYVIVVQGKTVRPRATIIGVQDSEVDYLFRHIAFGVWCCTLISCLDTFHTWAI